MMARFTFNISKRKSTTMTFQGINEDICKTAMNNKIPEKHPNLII
jgi:hypothetical protein